MGRTSTGEPSAFVRAATNGIRRSTRSDTPSTQKTRFGAHFARVFAVAYSLLGDEEAAKDAVAEAFSRVLPRSSGLGEDEFVVELFAAARDAALSSRDGESKSGSLTGREQELLAFVFDARLTREQIRRLMRTTEQGLSTTLLRAMRKLQAGIGPAAATA